MHKNDRHASSEVRVSDCGTWVQARIEGPITQQVALEFISEAARKAADHELSRFLFDLRGASNAKRPFEDYEIANYHLRELGFDLKSRVALLVTPGDQAHDFFKLTAANAGHDWRVLDDKASAIDYLKQPPPPPMAPRPMS